MIYWLPYALLFLRLILGPLLLLAALRGVAGWWLAVGLTLGFVSDILDGMIARRLNVAHARLRAWDSQIDGIFCGFVLASVWVRHPGVVKAFQTPLLWMLGGQGLSLVLDWWKYGRFSSYHAYSSKVAGAVQFTAIVGLFGFGASGWFLGLAIGIAILNHSERIAMTLLLPTWTHDVPSVFHALKRVR